MLERQDEELKKLRSQQSSDYDNIFPPLNKQQGNAFIEEEVIRNTTEGVPKIRKVANQLYNVTVKFDIAGCPFFKTRAIIDTRASSCFINKSVVPQEAIEPLNQSININGLNSQQQTKHKIKLGTFSIEGNKFRIPLIYTFEMTVSDGIEMLIGTNFIRAMK